MEYCNLKRDKRTGQSKGYCYVNFSTEESAKRALQALNGLDFPQGSGKKLKVRCYWCFVIICLRCKHSRRSTASSWGSGKKLKVRSYNKGI